MTPRRAPWRTPFAPSLRRRPRQNLEKRRRASAGNVDSAAASVGGLNFAARREGELLAGEGRGVHEAALCDGEYRHAFLIDARVARVFLAGTRSRGSAAGARAGGGAGRDRHGTGAGGKLE